MKPNPTVVVGMSGGVDSSVSALILKQQGYQVIGLFMKNWEEQNAEGICSSAIEFQDVVRVCDQIGIPYYSINFVKEYRENVFAHFLSELKAGNTPNPDILCNREIKFKVLLQKALELGADLLATGHYCQNRLHENRHQLLKGVDPGKDQSYFLHAIDPNALDKVLFPIGHLHKQEVRRIAKNFSLATSEKKDSTGICFIGERNFKKFLNQYLPYTPGDFEDLEGNKIGRHDGVAYYTLGQRKGLGIGGAGDAWFVAEKDIARNVVILCQGERHPALFCDALVATDLNWITPPGPLPFTCQSKVRYRQPDQACIIKRIEGGKAYVSFPEPQRAVTIGQSVVFYDGEVCLGGGVICSKGASFHERGLRV